MTPDSKNKFYGVNLKIKIYLNLYNFSNVWMFEDDLKVLSILKLVITNKRPP